MSLYSHAASDQWMMQALSNLFEGKTQRLKQITGDELDKLKLAIWTYADTRQMALRSPLRAFEAAPALLGHLASNSPENDASRLILSYGVTPSDIPLLPEEAESVNAKGTEDPQQEADEPFVMEQASLGF